MQAIDAPSAPASSDDAWERAAFHELHGRSLNGFALLVTLERPAVAARRASESINSGMARLDELRHPERAAAWLRADLLARTPRRAEPMEQPTSDLAALGVDTGVLAGLAALSPRERAALVAADVERLDLRDVATIVGRSGARLDRLLIGARRRYLARYLASTPKHAIAGSIGDHVAATARRALG